MSNTAKYQEILTSTADRIILIAGPGSGKTSGVMLPKASQLVSSSAINPKEVLLLTFSRIAAMDLKKKAQKLDKSPYATTVHSLCLSFLMSENDHAIRNRVASIVVLEAEKDTLISDLKLLFPAKDKRELKKELALFSAAWMQQPEDEIFQENEWKKAFKLAVMSWLSEHESVMMEEIAYHAVNLGRTLPDAAFFQKFKHIFVDEFQDLNKLEQEFIKIASANAKTLFVMGDPDQSIYSFKFAHPKGLETFAANFPTAERHSLIYIGRSAKKVVALANQLLVQADPARTTLLQPLPDKEDGEVHFIRRNTQEEEFDYVLNSVKQLIQGGCSPADILILTPRKKLGEVFVQYVNSNQDQEEKIDFLFLQKRDFSLSQSERIILLGLLANPNSLLHLRTYIGLRDDENFSKELAVLKEKYGNLIEVVANAKLEDCAPRQHRMKTVCQRIIDLRTFLESHREEANVEQVIDELFPEDNDELKEIRSMLIGLLEEHDTAKSLYDKLIDSIRVLPSPANVVKVMTPLASKGLEAEHVFIIGCNDGNIPGENHSAHLTEHEHIQEQRRLLFVAVTRAKKTLTISWSRYIPFEQARGHSTGSVATQRVNGRTMARVGICRFLEDLGDVTWE